MEAEKSSCILLSKGYRLSTHYAARLKSGVVACPVYVHRHLSESKMDEKVMDGEETSGFVFV